MLASPRNLFLSIKENISDLYCYLHYPTSEFVYFYCSGILIKTLANASHDSRSLSAPQIILNVVGFCLTVGTTVLVTVYSKRRLNELQKEEQLLLK